jgi:hypothetical protein
MEHELESLVGQRVSVGTMNGCEAVGTLEKVREPWLWLRDRKDGLQAVYIPNVCVISESR